MTIYSLYIKTHKKTGLKYLGQTAKDPYKYLGSGIDWKQHLKKFGKELNTEILLQTEHKEQRNYWGRYYSRLLNIVTAADDFGNKIWANRIPETGGGGYHTEERKELFRKQQTGKKKPPRTKEHTENQAATTRGRSNTKTSEGLRKWYDSNPDRSDSIEKQAKSLKEWYEDNPDKSHKKAEKTWATRIRKDYERLKLVHQMILNGLTNTEIQSNIKIDYATIKKLRNGSHRFFSIVIESE